MKGRRQKVSSMEKSDSIWPAQQEKHRLSQISTFCYKRQLLNICKALEPSLPGNILVIKVL